MKSAPMQAEGTATSVRVMSSIHHPSPVTPPSDEKIQRRMVSWFAQAARLAENSPNATAVPLKN